MPQRGKAYLKFRCADWVNRQTSVMRHVFRFLVTGGFALCAVLVQAADSTDWLDFNPPSDSFTESPIDLRGLNESFAGEHGVIAARGDRFVHLNIGRDPWRIRALHGTIRFKHIGAARFQPLDYNGYPEGAGFEGRDLPLTPHTIYYLVTRSR